MGKKNRAEKPATLAGPGPGLLEYAEQASYRHRLRWFRALATVEVASALDQLIAESNPPEQQQDQEDDQDQPDQ